MQAASTIHEKVKELHNGGKFALAIKTARAALNESPNDGELWGMLGITHHAMRNFTDAIRALETATLLTPLSPAAQVALAGAYLVTGCHDVARSMYLHLVAIRRRVPGPLLPLVAAGLARLDEKQRAYSIHCERADRDPDDDNALFAVAHYMRMLEYPVEVILPVAQRAFQLAPTRLRNRVSFALLAFQCGDLSTAYALMTEVPIKSVVAACCRCRLKTLAELFDAAEDQGRALVCRTSLTQVGS